MMTNMLHKRPMDDPKQFVLETLKSIHKEHHVGKEDPLDKNIYRFDQSFLERADFEAMFDAYDVLNIQQVSMRFVEHAME